MNLNLTKEEINSVEKLSCVESIKKRRRFIYITHQAWGVKEIIRIGKFMRIMPKDKWPGIKIAAFYAVYQPYQKGKRCWGIWISVCLGLDTRSIKEAWEQGEHFSVVLSLLKLRQKTLKFAYAGREEIYDSWREGWHLS